MSVRLVYIMSCDECDEELTHDSVTAYAEDPEELVTYARSSKWLVSAPSVSDHARIQAHCPTCAKAVA